MKRPCQDNLPGHFDMPRLGGWCPKGRGRLHHEHHLQRRFMLQIGRSSLPVAKFVRVLGRERKGEEEKKTSILSEESCLKNTTIHILHDILVVDMATLIRPPPPDPKSSAIESVLELTQLSIIDPNLFTNTRPLWHPPGARGIYGGSGKVHAVLQK